MKRPKEKRNDIGGNKVPIGVKDLDEGIGFASLLSQYSKERLSGKVI